MTRNEGGRFVFSPLYLCKCSTRKHFCPFSMLVPRPGRKKGPKVCVIKGALLSHSVASLMHSWRSQKRLLHSPRCLTKIKFEYDLSGMSEWLPNGVFLREQQAHLTHLRMVESLDCRRPLLGGRRAEDVST